MKNLNQLVFGAANSGHFFFQVNIELEVNVNGGKIYALQYENHHNDHNLETPQYTKRIN